ncbi:MAG TPA: VCBS repeat-containing protein [Thermoanaerobaculia bacterium]|nr:VCBS repeat-containing protein [Thermoanaerobaculia bacterium]
MRCALLVLALSVLPAAAEKKLELTPLRLALPGAPASLISADLDGDGRLDLAVAVVATSWGEIGVTESTKLDEVEGLVEVLTVVPALLDRRELHLFLQDGAGSFRPAGPPLTLPTTVHALLRGPAQEPLLALTDEGISVVRLAADGATSLEPWIEEPPVLAGSEELLPDLDLSHDLDGDGSRDLILPGREGLVIFLSPGGSLARQPAGTLALPLDERLPGHAAHYRQGLTRHYPLPQVQDLDGDGKVDLLVRNHEKGWNQFQALPGLGGGRFGAPRSPLGGRARDAEPEVVFVGDLDGEGRAELVTSRQLEKQGDLSMRQELAEAKRPRFELGVHRLSAGTKMDSEPARRFEVDGYVFPREGEIPIPGGFQDLNGDRRPDLITLTLDFSMLQALNVLAAKRISIGLDFHLWCQAADGSFRQVTGLDLSGRFTLNLNNLAIGQLSLFSGDFDGDGRADFVQMGRGTKVSIHRGRADCSYPAKPDLTIEVAEQIGDPNLVKVADLDGDGRSDLAITRPGPKGADGASAPVELALYLSGARP